VAAVVYKLLCKRPQDRLQTPADLAEHLRMLLAGRGVQVGQRARAAQPPPEQTQELGSSVFWAGVVAEQAVPAPPRLPSALRGLLLAGAVGMIALVAVVLAILVGNRGRKVEPVVERPPGPPPQVKNDPPVVPRAEEPPPGFVRLFNGEDLSGWKHVSGSKASDWGVEDGTLVNLARRGAVGHLETVKRYGDYTLRFEVRVAPKTFGGIHVRGAQVDIIDGPRGSPRGESGTLRNLGGTKDYFWLKARPGAFRGPGQWNGFEVVRRGDRVAVTLNGQPVNDQKVSASTDVAKPITIPQFNQRAEFRNLWIKELPDEAAAKPPELSGPSAVEVLTSPDWEWTEPVNLGPAINSAAFERDPALTADGLCLVFSSERGGQKWLYEARRKSAEEPFGDVRRLTELGGGEDTIGEPFLSADGLTMVFTSNQSGGYGKLDFWISRRPNREAAWGKPENLGQEVNSLDGKGSPALSADGLTIYFDKWMDSLRRHDLKFARRAGAERPWAQPESLGPDINTTASEKSPWPLPDGANLVFTRGQAEWLLATPAGGGWEIKSLSGWISQRVMLLYSDFEGI
jgi:hypothetical protein